MIDCVTVYFRCVCFSLTDRALHILKGAYCKGPHIPPNSLSLIKLWALSGSSGHSKSILKPLEKPCMMYSKSWYPSSNINIDVQPLLAWFAAEGLMCEGLLLYSLACILVFSIAPCVPWVLLTTVEATMVTGRPVTLAPCAPCVCGYLFAVLEGRALTPSPMVGFSHKVRHQHKPCAMDMLALLPKPNIIQIPVPVPLIQRSLVHDGLNMADIIEEPLEAIRMLLDVNPNEYVECHTPLIFGQGPTFLSI